MSAFGARRERSATIDLLPPEPGVRKRNFAPARPKYEIVDAHFVVLADGPAAHGTAYNDNHRRTRSRQAVFASQAGRLIARGLIWIMRSAERLLQLLPPRAFGAVVAGCFVAMFFFAGGLSALATVLVGAEPTSAVEIAGVTSSLDDRDGMKVLSVYGTIQNRSTHTREMPTIVVDVLAGGKSIARHRIEPQGGSLLPGAKDAFSLRLPHGGSNLPKIAISLEPAGASTR
ncbi:hypothetical protein IB238_20030 [Rhizobium sp. ARZ01]|uniref:hypothetical protein n=1 Tax=Rhizobium sp. ARZ01 TaxID=2769313 RepID=UPI001785DADB|nr:hypothetical protein [Rhizobium sp. ARZ01]MBD9374919.1 hypothetical protein [Rhizobium sp. ARZ01]